MSPSYPSQWVRYQEANPTATAKDVTQRLWFFDKGIPTGFPIGPFSLSLPPAIHCFLHWLNLLFSSLITYQNHSLGDGGRKKAITNLCKKRCVLWLRPWTMEPLARIQSLRLTLTDCVTKSHSFWTSVYSL